MKKQKFTLIELLVVIAIIAILASMLLPALGKARDRAYTAKCMSNLKTISSAYHMYADMYNGFLPGTKVWLGNENRACGYWQEYLVCLKLVPGPFYKDGKPRGIYHCPAERYERRYYTSGSLNSNIWNDYKGSAYGMNRCLCMKDCDDNKTPLWHKVVESRMPSVTYMVGDKWIPPARDSDAQTIIRARKQLPAERHSGRWNVAMIDGHIVNKKSYALRGHYYDDRPYGNQCVYEWRIR